MRSSLCLAWPHVLRSIIDGTEIVSEGVMAILRLRMMLRSANQSLIQAKGGRLGVFMVAGSVTCNHHNT